MNLNISKKKTLRTITNLSQSLPYTTAINKLSDPTPKSKKNVPTVRSLNQHLPNSVPAYSTSSVREGVNSKSTFTKVSRMVDWSEAGLHRRPSVPANLFRRCMARSLSRLMQSRVTMLVFRSMVNIVRPV